MPLYSRNPVTKERVQRSLDVYQPPRPVESNRKNRMPITFDMAGQLVKIGISPNTDETIASWLGYHDMKQTRKQASQASNELKRTDRSRNPPQGYRETLFTVQWSRIHLRNPNFPSSQKFHRKRFMDKCNEAKTRLLAQSGPWQLLGRKRDEVILPARSVYRKKTDCEGQVKVFKAIYVAKRDKQGDEINYFKTSARTSKPETFQTLPVFAAKKGFMLRQLDVILPICKQNQMKSFTYTSL